MMGLCLQSGKYMPEKLVGRTYSGAKITKYSLGLSLSCGSVAVSRLRL